MLTVYSDGQIARDGKLMEGIRIRQEPNGKFLTGAGHDVDVELAFGHAALPAIVDALIEGHDLPSGWKLGTRKDGIARVSRA
ncbi:hypothetical protein [Nitrospirillum sp. BR 11163]|uniref:hypothetical protein n=1 Tax=Nitrospirillum sp. BR 11163 TaxID=3104323 RepID=UPI002AFFB943|nr:hypothetical protein [Nitrospirillum sp. BR 11163]MEA1674125.1 hypothetical protein [Nitrospirillum sp. BR 11163]